MCTSITLPLPDGTQLFGRTLDWHEHFDERILQVPQGFSFDIGNRLRVSGGDRRYRHSCYAILGMGTEGDGYPLFADGMNERGLCMAGLRFAASAHYLSPAATPPTGFLCLSPWEMIPFVLGFCGTLDDAREALSRVRVVDRPFPASGGEIPNAPLHWHVADCRHGGSLVIEATAQGLRIYDAPLGVLTNDPLYPEQMAAYEEARRTGVFLPAGYDSTARFVRAAHLRELAVSRAEPYADMDAVTRFFRMAAAVSPQQGDVRAIDGEGWQTTLYTACMDGARGRYLYTTADYPEPHAVTFSDAPGMTFG